MRLLFLVQSLGLGGAERQLVTLVKGLKRKGHRVLVAVFYPGGELRHELELVNVPVVCLDKRNRWDVFPFTLRLIRLLRQHRPEILHSYLVVPNILSVFMRPLFPSIRVVWGVRASEFNLSPYDWLWRWSEVLEYKLARFAHVIIANSHAGKACVAERGFPREKIRVIPNGIDTQKFCPHAESRARVRAEWGITDKDKLIGLVARLDPMKDHPTFLKAAAVLAKQREDTRFVCVGDGSPHYRQQLHALGHDLGLDGRIIWAGTRTDMPAVYNALDIACSSSSTEGFPNAIGEAMACGTICVVTDVGDSAELVGTSDLVVNPQNSESLAAKLGAVLEQFVIPHIENSDALRRRVTEHFSVQRLIDDTERSLLSLVS